MSEVSDPIAVDSSLACDSSPGLADLSERDKVWNKHRANADLVAVMYANTKEFHSYSQRVNFCSELLEFCLVPEHHEGIYGLKLSNARFCRVRHCPVCQWRRSLMWKAKAYKVIPKVVQDYPEARWLFLTLTLKNCPIAELRQTLKLMTQAFKRLTLLKDWPAIGWVKSTEVTRSKDNSAHPHFHCLLMVKPSFFGRNYINQAEWSELWRQCLRVDYQPVTHIRAIKKDQDPRVIVPEILKYQVKESDLVNNAHWFRELTKQLHRTRAIATGGILKDYLRELEEEPADLIGESDDPEQVDEGRLYFGWKRWEKKYRMVDRS